MAESSDPASASRAQATTAKYPVQVKTARHGLGAFATRPIETGERVLEFAGPLVGRDQVTEENAPHVLQVGRNRFLGPSGAVDDFVNHSCLPNTRVVIGEEGSAHLSALRPIAVGEEVTFDYSATMWKDDWSMRCACGALSCRGRVVEFWRLPDPVRRRLIWQGEVPDFVLTMPDGSSA